eukprot:XP_006588020.1 elongation factor 1-delta [Glycine max]
MAVTLYDLSSASGLKKLDQWYKHIDALLRISGVSGEGSLVAAPPTADTKATGKSSVMLDVKPWDDETDMKKLEEAVRSIEMEGLLFGAFFDSFTIMFALLSRFFFSRF